MRFRHVIRAMTQPVIISNTANTMSRSKMSRVVSSLMVLNASNPRTLIISFPSLSSQGDRVVQGDPFVQGDLFIQGDPSPSR